jgi:cytoskeleton protein RodZ
MTAPVLLEPEGNVLKEERKLSVGAYLSQERKRRNISLADVAKATRIAPQYLEALERDEFHAFPASIFIRGFLRTYSVQIGLDPKEVLRMYETQTSSMAAFEKGGATRTRSKTEPLAKYISILLIMAVGVGVAFFFFFKGAPVPPSPSTTSSPDALQSQVPLAKDSSPEPLPAPQKEVPKTLEDRKPEKSPEGLSAAVPLKAEKEKKKERRHVLKVKATETTWLRIQPDDLPDFDALLQPDETATWTARRKFILTVGNAGGVEISFNGKPLGVLGESGQVVTLLLPKEIKPPEEKKEEQ